MLNLVVGKETARLLKVNMDLNFLCCWNAVQYAGHMVHDVEMIDKESGLVYLLEVTGQRNLSTSRKCLVYDWLVEAMDISVGHGTAFSHCSI
jgi:hypothetical protein